MLVRIFCFLLLLTGAGSVSATDCAALLPMPSATVSSEGPNIVYKHVNYITMQSITPDKRQLTTSSGVYRRSVQGLTVSDRQLGVINKLNYRKYKGGYCISPALTISVVKRNITVLLPDWYAVHSCEHQAVLAHENKHVKIEIDVADNAIAGEVSRIRNEISRYVGWVRDMKEAEQWSKQFAQAVERRILESLKAVEAANKSLDTMENYDHEESACRGWTNG